METYSSYRNDDLMCVKSFLCKSPVVTPNMKRKIKHNRAQNSRITRHVYLLHESISCFKEQISRGHRTPSLTTLLACKTGAL